MEEGDLAFASAQPAGVAVAYLRSKGWGVSWDWHDTWELAHARAFVVAKAARLDVLSTLRRAVDAAVSRGQTQMEFLAELEPRLRALGWWGRKVVTGPDGVAREAQLGSPRRLKTIFDTNMRVANAAGRFRAQHDNREARPYWQYIAMNDDRTRRSHRAMSGRVFRADDRIWHTHYPPNGFNCRCRIRALTGDQVERMGLAVHDSAGHLAPYRRADGSPGQVVGYDRRTGEAIVRPATSYWIDGPGDAIELTPDPGWNYNPGRTVAAFGPVTGDPHTLSPLVGGQTDWRALGLPAALPASRAPARLPAADTPAAAKQQILDAVAEGNGTVVRDGARDLVVFAKLRAPTGDDVMLTDAWLAHVVDDHDQADARERWARYLRPTIAAPGEIWLSATLNSSGQIVYRRRFVASFEGTSSIVAVFEERPFGTGALTFHPARSVNRQRRGYLLWPRWPGGGSR